MSWNVKQNNWIDYTQKQINSNSTNSKSSFIIKPSPDPASGCNKEFVSTYACDPNTTLKTISISAPADGKAAVFDCSSEYKQCLDGKLTVGDNGNVTFEKSDGTIIWQSGTSTVGIELDQYKAVNSKYGRNYLLTGEYLLAGEFVGSPSGNCALICQTGSSTKFSLDIVYFEISCNKSSSSSSDDSKSNYLPSNDTTQSAYCMSKGAESNENANIVTYSSGDMVTNDYRSSDLGNCNSYISLGNYDLDADNLVTLKNSDLNSCKTKCNSLEKCGGYIFSNKNQQCKLREFKNIYPENTTRVSDPDSEMFLRQLKVNNSLSCSNQLETTYGDIYSKLQSGPGMTKRTLCGLAEFTKNQRKQVLNAEKQLNTARNQLFSDSTSLNTTNQKIDKKMLTSISKQNSDLKSYDQIKKKTQIANNNLVDIGGMQEDANLEMVSKNIQNTVWTAAVIIGVVIAIKLSR